MPTSVASKSLRVGEAKPFGQITPLVLPPGVPERVGRYRLLRFIGSGGFGLVFEANDESLNRRVAIKLARSHVTVAESLTKRFLDEARIRRWLEHVGIVSPLMRMFSMASRSLFIHFVLVRFFRNGWRRKQYLVAAVGRTDHVATCGCCGLSHARYILHRDIKPANVLLFPTPQTFLSSASCLSLQTSA